EVLRVRHASVDPRGESAPSPGKKRREQRHSDRAVRALHADVRRIEVPGHERHSVMRFGSALEQNDCGWLGLKEELVSRDGDLIGALDACKLPCMLLGQP